MSAKAKPHLLEKSELNNWETAKFSKGWSKKTSFDLQNSLLRGRQVRPQQSHLSGDFKYVPSRFPLTQIVDILWNLPNQVSSKGKSPPTHAAEVRRVEHG